MKTQLSMRTFVHFTGNMGTTPINYLNVEIELPSEFNQSVPEYCIGRLNIPTAMLPELIRHLETALGSQEFSLRKELEVTE